jgi:DNA-binding SARP family transcriptional activator
MKAVGDEPGVTRPVIRVFGALQIKDGTRVLGPRDLGGVRPKQLLEILLAARGRLVPVDRIAELIWEEERPDDTSASIQTFVSVLRRRLVENKDRARALVVTEAEAYRFATDAVDLDLDRFDVLLERSAREPTRASRASLEEALSLVRGDVFEDEPYALWTHDIRGSYRGRVLGARLDAADAALAESDFAAALMHVEEAAVLDPFSERAQRLQMLTLYALDRTHEALARYRTYRARLDDELGLEPSAETRSMETAVIQQADIRSLLPRPIERIAVDSGREPSRFVGRQNELDLLMRAIDRGISGKATVSQIEGTTGIGKTMLLDQLRARLRGARVGRASCSVLERNLPYVPLAAAVREALAGVEVDCSRLPALQHVLPELALDAPKASFDEVEVLEALIALLIEHEPVVLLLDDLHLADHRTLAGLSYLHRRRAFAGAITTTARPTDASPGRPPHRLDADVRIQLEPLSYDDLRAAGLGDLHEATGGDPRLVAEALACGDVAPPSKTLTDALLSQCRAEGEWSYRILTTASVLTQPFEPEQIADLTGASATDVVEDLERLCERRILRIDGLGFRFRNDLIRHVLLESISPARQQLLLQSLRPDAMNEPRSAVPAIGLQAS